MYELSAAYTNIYADLLKSVGSNPSIAPESQTAFWPVRGRSFDGDLLVIGRFTNGWFEEWTKQQMVSEIQRPQVIETVRSHSESKKNCSLAWVVNCPPELNYNPNRSHFWNAIKDISLDGVEDNQRVANWSSYICWSNLYKIAPPKPVGATMTPHPSGLSKRVQMPFSVSLLNQELEEFSPRRVLVLAGKGLFSPFAERLGLKVQWRAGYVEGIAFGTDRKWVIAKHPQGKPKAVFVSEVLKAFAD